MFLTVNAGTGPRFAITTGGGGAEQQMSSSQGSNNFSNINETLQDVITGPVPCNRNSPAPTNIAIPNTIGGPTVGQCAGL